MKPTKTFTFGEGKWWKMLEKFLEWLKVHNYANATIKNRYEHLIVFINWCVERELLEPREIGFSHLERFQIYTSNYRKENTRYLGIETQAQRITSIKVFFRYLLKHKHIETDPSSDLIMPKVEKRLPRSILSIKEVEHLLKQADMKTPTSLRDRAMMEVLYSSAIRRAELANLSINDIDKERGMIFIRCGKGAKDRVVPIGERAIAFIELYVEKVRPLFAAKSTDEGKLFLNQYGEAFKPKNLNKVFSKYIKQSGLEVKASCHTFRYTTATLMLEAGADIRYIQEMLGHAYLSTTQIYTHVFDSKLKEVHSRTHPSAKLLNPIIKPSQSELELELELETENNQEK